ncbi:MAG TPA: DNA replication/repair protein RecF [Bacillota bacterium]|nr:DNA replication/repair protein RecF [Bacillota bacterium]
MLALYLREFSLKNFRNYNSLNLKFSSNLIYFIGPNAQGKTNIIEAIFLSCTGRSHRTSKERELINWDSDEALVRTSVEKQEGSSEISIYLSRNEKKRVNINGTQTKRLGELMGHLNSVIFSPEDLKLVKEGPVERRRFMDIEISQINPRYFYYLQQYNRVLNHRNNLLKEIQRKPSLRKTLPVWNEQLIKSGSYIIQQRIKFVNSLQNISREIHKEISHGDEDLSIEYRTSIPTKAAEIGEIRESFSKELEKKEKDDIERGVTSRGCHRDDMGIDINGADVRTFGSQGQKRTTVLSLKLSELEFMYNETGEFPLLLLDDVMSELDPVRQQMLLKYIGKVQTFITTTDINHLPQSLDSDREEYFVEKGSLSGDIS